MPRRYAQVGRQEAGEYQNAVSARYNVIRSTSSWLWQRYQQSDSTNYHARSRRLRITIPVQDRCIRVFQLWNRPVPASQTDYDIPGQRRISAQTVPNRLREHGIRARRPYFLVLS